MRPALSVASECVPLVKTGGLADVVGALPGAMAGAGWALKTLIPGYPVVMKAVSGGAEVWASDDVIGAKARVLAAKVAGLDLLVLDAPAFFDREGSIYLGADGEDYPDNPERFAALAYAAAEIATKGIDGWVPEVVHLHDWQAALTPTYMKDMGAKAGTLLTIHNVAFHGAAPASLLKKLKLPKAEFSPGGFEFWGQINMLKAGITSADKISTVSPTYAHELTTPEFGMGLDGVLAGRRDDLSGILNGIDTDLWDPSADGEIIPFKTAKGKGRAKKRLEQEFDLPAADGPLCIVVSRLTEQKGLDILLDALPALVDRGGRLALLGTGDAKLEAAFKAAAEAHPFVSVHIGYDEAKAHRMFAGADAVLVPSRFEPCGLTQMFGLRYGAVPLVALTGGLADTVIPANAAAMKEGVATGFQFHPINADALAHALIRLCALFRDTQEWTRLQRNAMKHPVGWETSARAYADLYEEIAK